MLKALLENKAEQAAEIKRLADLANEEGREWTPEDEAQYERANVAYNETLAEIVKAEDRNAKAERAAEIQKQVEQDNRRNFGREDRRTGGDGSQAVTEEHRMLALQGWMRYQQGMDPSDQQVEAAQLLGKSFRSASFDLELRSNYDDVRREFRAAQTVTTSGGGHLIPEGFVANLEQAMLHFAAMRQVADVIRTDSGNQLPWPTINDTSNTGEDLAINTGVAEQAITLGQFVLNAYKQSSGLVLVPMELMEDSAFNMATLLPPILGERLGRRQNAKFTTGTGSGQANGIVTAAAAGVTAASTTAITADEIINLFHAVDIAYRNNPGAGFMAHDNTWLAVRKLKDGDNQYLWQPGLQAGAPDTILGKRALVNNDMDSTLAANDIAMIFGDLSKYKIRDVRAVRFKRLVERYAEADQEGFVALVRSDGDLLNAGTNPVKKLAMAAS